MKLHHPIPALNGIDFRARRPSLSRWTPCSRREFVSKLARLGFEGPYSGTKHQFMVFGVKRLPIPSYPEYSVPKLREMVREVEAIVERDITVEDGVRL